ncbi:MAG: DUF3127 domain-containing protein [Balneolaceae bacterium]|nr:DUF3127 domain-containing protein [Balneolaceae bacterium]
MDLKITGTVKQILDMQSGEGKNGPWKKQDFILETPGKYPRQICVTQWGEQIDKSNVQEGETLTVWIDIQSREYNGRWYTDIKAWRVERGDSSGETSKGAMPDDEKVIDFGADDDEEPPF